MQRSAGSYFRKSPPLLLKNQTTDISPMWKSPGKFRANGKRGTSPNQVILFTSWEQWPEWKCSVGSRWERISAKKRKEKESRKVRWRRWAPSNGLHLEKKREAGLRLIRFHTPLSLSWGFSNKWGSGHDRQGKAVAMHSSDMTKLEYWLRSCGAGLIDGWFSWWWMFRQLFTAATLVT